MKSVKLMVGLLALVPSLSFAQGMMERPHRGEFLDTILESVDDSTAADLQASREELTALHEEIRTLRRAEVLDEAALEEAVANLRAERENFREEVSTIIDGNEDLQATLEDAREGSGHGRGRFRGHRGMRPEAVDTP